MNSRPLGGRYQIIRQLGSGGFSRTFLVEDLHLPSNPRCIIKQLQPQTRDARALEMARRLFDTEAKVLYQLGSHLQIPTLLAHFEDNQEFYLAQEYIEGAHLSREFVRGVPWPQARVVLLMQEVLKVLLFVHDRQVIHRDIKPSNLIRRFQDNQIVLIDFGAVKRVSTSPLRDLDSGSTNLTVAIGTQGYMPNEQYAGKPRYSSDIYAVGMLGIRALTGVHPRDIMDDPLTGELNWRQHASGVGQGLAEVIDTMVRCDFRDRYPTASEALSALQALPESECRIYLPRYSAASIAPQSTHSLPLALESSQVQEAVLVTADRPEAEAIGCGPQDDSQTFFYDPDSTAIFGEAAPSSDGRPENEAIDRPSRLAAMPSQLLSPRRAAVLGTSLLGLSALGAATLAHGSQPVPFLAALSINLPPISEQALSIVSAEQMAAFQVQQADALRAEGQPVAALAIYDQAVTTKFDYAPAHLGRCMSFLAVGKPDEATVACNDALAYQGYFPQAVRAKGNALEQQGRLLEALSYYEETNRQMPALFAAWLDRGRVLQGLGRSAEAIEALDQAIARDRRSAEAWTVRGKASWALNRADEAIVSLDKALMLQPGYEPAVDLRRQIRQQLGR